LHYFYFNFMLPQSSFKDRQQQFDFKAVRDILLKFNVLAIRDYLENVILYVSINHCKLAFFAFNKKGGLS